MFFESIGVYENVVKVGDSKFVKEFTDNIVDVSLEGAGGIA